MSCKHDFKLRSIGSVYTCTKCDMDVSVEMMQQLQQASKEGKAEGIRLGWEQAKGKIAEMIKQQSNDQRFTPFEMRLQFSKKLIDAIAAMEYGGGR